jgi:NAD(P)-dependent dehydrogenase (short-subunit alcohol dehydrogenase family)
MSKVMVIGATGTIGSAIVELLDEQHEVIKVAHTHGDFQVDLASKDSIAALFAAVGKVDAVICAAGEGKFGPLDQLTDDDFMVSIGNKLMGQVNVIRLGRHSVNPGGSITVTTGVLSRKPIKGGSALSLVNGGLEGFVRAAALELEGLRVNAVSPGWVKETMIAMGMDPGPGMSAAKVAFAYRAALEGSQTGHVLDTREFA